MMTNVRYHASFSAKVFYPKCRVTKDEQFGCDVFVNPDVYSNGTYLADMALSHAWCKVMDHFFTTSYYGIPLSITLRDLMEVEKNA